MEMKVKNVILARPVLDELMKQKLPVRVSFKIALLLKRLFPVFEAFDEQRNAIIITMGVQDDTGTYTVPPERTEEANKRIAELGEEIVVIEYPLIDIGLFQDVSMTPSDLFLLEPFLTEQF